MSDVVEPAHLSDVIGALSYALDMTEGQPMGHSLRCCWLGMHVGMKIGLSQAELSDLYYVLLLKDIGCSSNAARICSLFLTDDLGFKRDHKFLDNRLPDVLRFLMEHTARNSGLVARLQSMVHAALNGGEIARELVETRCQRGADIAHTMRFSDAVAEGILDLDEHWDGSGQPLGLRGTEISMFSRIALLAQVADVFFMHGGEAAALAELRSRAGRWFDPVLVAVIETLAADQSIWTAMRSDDLARLVGELEPRTLIREVDEDYLDDIAKGFAKVVDAKSPFTAGHSERVAFFADLIANEMGYTPERRRWLRRAALLHDIGKLGVSNTVLDKNGSLNPEEWVAVKRHPELGRTILSKIVALRDTAVIAGNHHERLDGKGYPNGIGGQDICLHTRIVTVADIFDALTADRPYRKAMSVTEALELMARDLTSGLDPSCFTALQRGLDRPSRRAA